MSIFSERPGHGNTLADISVELTYPIMNNSTLVYNYDKRKFVLKTVDDTLPVITGAINLGGANAIGLYSDKNSDILEFKQLIAGSGIQLVDSPNSITINSNISSGTLSVPGSYSIVIDNDNNTTNAKFEIFTVRSTTTSPTIITQNNLPPVISNKLYTGNINNFGYFQSQDIDFVSYGFKSGMTIVVSGTANQNNYWTIQDVETVVGLNGQPTISTIIITIPFTGQYGFNLGGPQLPTTISEYDFVILPENNIQGYDPTKLYILQSFNNDFGPMGLNITAGMVLHLQGSASSSLPSNDGYYTVQSVIQKSNTILSSILFSSDNPFPGIGGPVLSENSSIPVTLTISTSEQSTGFSVDESGNVTATTIITNDQISMGENTKGSLLPQNYNDLVRKDYVDNLLSPIKGKPKQYYMAFIKW